MVSMISSFRISVLVVAADTRKVVLARSILMMMSTGTISIAMETATLYQHISKMMNTVTMMNTAKTTSIEMVTETLCQSISRMTRRWRRSKRGWQQPARPSRRRKHCCAIVQHQRRNRPAIGQSRQYSICQCRSSRRRFATAMATTIMMMVQMEMEMEMVRMAIAMLLVPTPSPCWVAWQESRWRCCWRCDGIEPPWYTHES